MTYKEARNYLNQAAKKGIVLGLTVMEELLKRLGNPEKQLKIVHIAGTNGKGSILSFMEQMFLEAGYRTGRYVSPVIGDYEERFLLSAVPVSKEKIPSLVKKVKEAADGMKEEIGLFPTVFEIETAMAFLLFAEEQVDVLLLETGMGGRLDATNVIEPPLLSVIASVSEDHMPILGTCLREIAKEKAGIIKTGSRVLLYPVQDQEVREAVSETCEKKQVPLFRVKAEEITVLEETKEKSRFSYGEEYVIHLPGRHQIFNAVTALCGIKLLSEEFPALKEKECKINGLSNTRWKGRLEKLGERPLIYLDGAHNRDGAKKLAEFLEEHFKGKRIIGVTGVLKDKEYDKMMSLVLPLMEKTAVFPPNNERGLPAEELFVSAKKYCSDTVVMPGCKEALDWALSEAGEEDVIILFGSLSFISELGDR